MKNDSKVGPSGPKSELFATIPNNPATKAIATLKMIFRIFILKNVLYFDAIRLVIY